MRLAARRRFVEVISLTANQTNTPNIKMPPKRSSTSEVPWHKTGAKYAFVLSATSSKTSDHSGVESASLRSTRDMLKGKRTENSYIDLVLLNLVSNHAT
jgi:hypothetical protein